MSLSKHQQINSEINAAYDLAFAEESTASAAYRAAKREAKLAQARAKQTNTQGDWFAAYFREEMEAKALAILTTAKANLATAQAAYARALIA